MPLRPHGIPEKASSRVTYSFLEGKELKIDRYSQRNPRLC